METIFALSSGMPPTAIAIVRISGPQAGATLERLIGRVPESRRATSAILKHPVTGELLDRALVIWFAGPNTATGEDLAELHLHGGRAVVARVLEVLGAMAGLRLAEPGEFTRRAFENGRIDLAEAEGLSDLLFAETERQRQSALAMAEGGLSTKIVAWQGRLLDLTARVEALLDFADEEDVSESQNVGDTAIARGVSELAGDISAFLARPNGKRLRDGIRVALAGPPNAGKSSLINALAGRTAAIVSPKAGTTRDVIEVPLAFDGIPFVFIDLAGLHEPGDDEIEQIGIARAREVIESSDIILWLDDTQPSPRPEATIVVQSRCDLAEHSMLRSGADVAVSAVDGTGLDVLVQMVVAKANMLLPVAGEVSINERQRGLMAECLAALVYDDDLLLTAENLRLARLAIDRITGRSGTEEMLDALFSRFCIGK